MIIVSSWSACIRDQGQKRALRSVRYEYVNMRMHIIKIKSLHGHLIFIVGKPVPGKMFFMVSPHHDFWIRTMYMFIYVYSNSNFTSNTTILINLAHTCLKTSLRFLWFVSPHKFWLILCHVCGSFLATRSLGKLVLRPTPAHRSIWSIVLWQHQFCLQWCSTPLFDSLWKQSNYHWVEVYRQEIWLGGISIDFMLAAWRPAENNWTAPCRQWWRDRVAGGAH